MAGGQQNRHLSYSCSCSVLTESKPEEGLQVPDLTALCVYLFIFFHKRHHTRVVSRGPGVVGISVHLGRCYLFLLRLNVLKDGDTNSFIS